MKRAVQFWGSDRLRLARLRVVISLYEVDSRIRKARLDRPGAFWAVLLGILIFAIVFAVFSGVAVILWGEYSTNRENIVPIATFVGAAFIAYAALKQAAT